ncbi:hypothetical protein FA15DRAFT_658336 [Coprinopsis marcescibilis]|uniref:Uncharacterized protein n=1 Tax=Coprinopsis marcescibilis TaxID=230819 RepID=A0A5C3KM79_COPMA|nr:hypothetical protein FA15DRAFT_658336 [Coprinopsis marcescibilis]
MQRCSIQPFNPGPTRMGIACQCGGTAAATARWPGALAVTNGTNMMSKSSLKAGDTSFKCRAFDFVATYPLDLPGTRACCHSQAQATTLQPIDKCNTSFVEFRLASLALHQAVPQSCIGAPNEVISTSGLGQWTPNRELVSHRASWKLIEEHTSFVPQVVYLYIESKIGLVYAPHGDQGSVLNGEYVAECPTKRCGYFDKALAGEQLTYLSDFDPKFNESLGLYKAAPVREVLSRGIKSKLRVEAPMDAVNGSSKFVSLYSQGLQEDEFWSLFVQCAHCTAVMPKDVFWRVHTQALCEKQKLGQQVEPDSDLNSPSSDLSDASPMQPQSLNPTGPCLTRRLPLKLGELGIHNIYNMFQMDPNTAATLDVPPLKPQRDSGTQRLSNHVLLSMLPPLTAFKSPFAGGITEHFPTGFDLCRGALGDNVSQGLVEAMAYFAK